MVEQAGLENRCTLTGTVGSNPTHSAKKQALNLWRMSVWKLIVYSYIGEVLEWPNRHDWKSCVSLRIPRVRIPPSPPKISRGRYAASHSHYSWRY